MICYVCYSDLTETIIDFGDVALAGNFLTKDQIGHEDKYPLKLKYCHNCHAVQVDKTVPPEELFFNYRYHSSTIPKLNTHFKQYAEYVVDRFLPPSIVTIVAIF